MDNRTCSKEIVGMLPHKARCVPLCFINILHWVCNLQFTIYMYAGLVFYMIF